jgi:tetratricopeptide (TPR) repeat protein
MELPALLIPDFLIPRFLYAVPLLVLALISALYLPGYYRQTKPDWRGAGVYLAARTTPGDVIVTGPLFDVGRYLDYYYDGPAELMPPALLVATLPDRVASMRASGGRVWAVTRFRPAAVAAVRPVAFSGLTVSEPVVPIYEPEILTAAMVDLMQQAVAAAPGWAAEMSAEGMMDPEPLVARAAAYLFLGDVYRAAGRLPEAVAAYEAMVADSPASVGGYITLAEAYEAAGQPEAAVGAYRRAVALNPAWQGVHADAAASLADAGRWAEAAAAYRAIIE